MDAQYKEWCDLKEWERNSLMWPHLLQWHEPRRVSIRLPHPNDRIGLVTTSVHDQMTGKWYNIIKHTRENHPVHNNVNHYEWVFEVDGATTTNCPSDKFSVLFKNGKNEILLSLMKTVDPLSAFQKEWGAEKIVTLTLKDKNHKTKLKLRHFYSKKDNEDIKDHILISEVNLGHLETLSEPLHQGDELLAVNGQQLKKGETLAEIWGRISREIPALVKLTIKKIQPNTCKNEEVVKIPIQETSKTRKVLSSLTERLSLKRNSGGNKVENEELTSKDRSKVSALKNQPVRRFPPTNDKMCGKCLMNRETQLPDNRDEWPIDNIEHGCFEEMCQLIDLSDYNSKPLMGTLNFSRTDADLITRQFAPRGGLGVAKKALGKWGASAPSHNVSALKEILKYEIKRFDALRVIEKWEAMSVCHGCGVKHPSKEQQ